MAPEPGGPAVETDPRRIWQRFAEHYYLFRGTPTGIWFDHALSAVFGVREKLTGETAQAIYDQIATQLAAPDFRPRALYDRFGIEVLATTDAATDPLVHHQAIRHHPEGWDGVVVPTFRPDALFRIAAPGWRAALQALETATGTELGSVPAFLRALEARRAYFKQLGATATDHAVLDPWTERLSAAEVEALYQKARAGTATADDQRRFEAHLLMEMARMSVEDGLVMQLHPGAYRDHNVRVAQRWGPDKGADIPVRTEYTRNLHAVLNAYGNDPKFTLVVFTLDEATYARELAPLAGHYPALRLGPPWWFHDSLDGMQRFRQATTETASLYKTAGFNDDTRAFCSIPARHDLARRVDANYLGGLVARHVVDLSDARAMARALAYDLVKETYRFTTTPRTRRASEPETVHAAAATT